MVGPLLGGQLGDPRAAVWVTVGCSLAATLGALLFVPESLKPEVAITSGGLPPGLRPGLRPGLWPEG